jgi:hypothetical protein
MKTLLRKRVILIILLCVLLLLPAGLIGYKAFIQDSPNTVNNRNPLDENVINKDLFSLEYEYSDEEEWSYVVTGMLPTPCHEVKVDVIVRTSLPEQVSVRLMLTDPSIEIVCTQVLREFEYKGTFKASKDAKLDFFVGYNE